MPGRMIMTFEQMPNYAREQRKAGESLFLLLDPTGDCEAGDKLHISQLAVAFGTDAITRIVRNGLGHAPEQCPALIQLAAPGQAITEYFAMSIQFAAAETAANKLYVSGWLFSEHPAAVIASHIASQSQLLQPTDGQISAPWYEPTRLALLRTAMKNAGKLLGPIRAWLYPNISGDVTALDASPLLGKLVVPEIALDVQRFAPQITQLLAAWRRVNASQHNYAPWQYTGDGGLPHHAPSHAFNLIYDAHRRGLRDCADIQCLCLHTVMLHPLLLQHPTIEKDVQRAVAGKQNLNSRFATYDDAAWRQIVAALPEARSYS